MCLIVKRNPIKVVITHSKTFFKKTAPFRNSAAVKNIKLWGLQDK